MPEYDMTPVNDTRLDFTLHHLDDDILDLSTEYQEIDAETDITYEMLNEMEITEI